MEQKIRDALNSSRIATPGIYTGPHEAVRGAACVAGYREVQSWCISVRDADGPGF